MNQYSELIQEYLPTARAKTIMMYLPYLDRSDGYFTDFARDVYPKKPSAWNRPGVKLEYFSPGEVFSVEVEHRLFYGYAMQWLCESSDQLAEVYFRSVAAVLMFKDIMRVICNMGVSLPQSLWLQGDYPADMPEDKRPFYERQAANAMVIFDNWIGEWPSGFFKKPDKIPYKVATSFVDIATLEFEPYVQSYLRVVGRLEDFQREFGELKQVVNLEEYVEMDDQKSGDENEALFMAVHEGPESYMALKEKILDDLTRDTEPDEKVDHTELLRFLKNTPPAPLPPIIVNVPTPIGPKEEGSSYGMIGGALFTMWLLANMS